MFFYYYPFFLLFVIDVFLFRASLRYCTLKKKEAERLNILKKKRIEMYGRIVKLNRFYCSIQRKYNYTLMLDISIRYSSDELD